MRKLKLIAARIIKDIKDLKIAILAFVIYSIIIRKIFKAFCPLLIITGFPCAGCGMTRAMYCLVTLQLKRAISLNPASPLWLMFVIWFMWNRYVRGIFNKKKTTIFLSVVCIITLVIYIYRMINFFPGHPPMVYYKNNIIRWLLLHR